MNVNSILEDFLQYRLARLTESPMDEANWIDDVYHRLAFVQFAENSLSALTFSLFSRRFLRSLQAYLLLSAGDALGKGSSYYSFEDFIRSSEGFSILKDEATSSTVLGAENLRTTILKAVGEYKKLQSVKQRFMFFWNNRSEYVKAKVVLSFYPRQTNDFSKVFQEIVLHRFYELYRNPFTHESKSNFPPLSFSPKEPFVFGKGEIRGVGFHRADGKSISIDTPLLVEEADRIFAAAHGFYYEVMGMPDEPVQIVDAEDLRDRVLLISSFKTAATASKDRYVHNGLIKTLMMGILEGIGERIGKPIDWMTENPYLA